MPSKNRVGSAVSDLLSGLKLWRIWARLAILDVKEKYKRSLLGPFWITISTFVMVLVFGVLYGSLLNEKISKHLPYVSVGFVIWLFYSESIVRGCHVFIANGRMIQQIRLPASLYVYRLMTEAVIGFLHNIIIIFVIYIYLWLGIELTALVAVFGLLLIMMNVLCLVVIFGIISMRYRDFPQIVAAMMRPMMFLTPVIWNAERFPDRAFFVEANPFYHIVELFRAPMLGHFPAALSWVYVISMNVFLLIAAFYLFARYRHRIAYWV